MDDPHVPACNKYIRITTSFILSTFTIDLQGAGVTWSTRMSALVIRNIRITILFSLTTFKINLRGACHLDNPHVATCNEYIRITILFSLTPFEIDLQGAGVTWTTHMSLLVISTSESLSYLA